MSESNLSTEPDSRWQRVVERDARADGTFVYAVKTTGIYCRPGRASHRRHSRRPLESGPTCVRQAGAMGGRRRRVATYHRLIAAIGVGNQGTRAPVASRPKRRLAQDRCSCPWVRRSSALPSTPIPRLATLDLAQLLQDGAAAHGLEQPQLLHLLGTRSAVALRPQVDGGTAHSNQAPVVGHRQAQLGTVGGPGVRR